MPVAIVNWNVEWATPKSWRTPEIRLRIAGHAPDVVCLTESDAGLLDAGGHVITACADFGAGPKGNRRKVLLWSREPWECVDACGSSDLPPGRFVSGVTRTALGEMTVIGVCIPWSGSRAMGANKTRKTWEDHEAYIKGLAPLLNSAPSKRLIVMGDFNQRIGSGGNVPNRLRAALQDAIPPNLSIATAALGQDGKRSTDHIVLSRDLAADSLGVISNQHEGRKLSDHFGVFAALSAQS